MERASRQPRWAPPADGEPYAGYGTCHCGGAMGRSRDEEIVTDRCRACGAEWEAVIGRRHGWRKVE